MLGIPCIRILVRNLLYGLELMYGNRFLKSGAHCVGNVHMGEVCTLCGKRAHFVGSVHIVWEVSTFYRSDNHHFTVFTISFISIQYRLFRPYKATCFDQAGHIKAFC